MLSTQKMIKRRNKNGIYYYGFINVSSLYFNNYCNEFKEKNINMYEWISNLLSLPDRNLNSYIVYACLCVFTAVCITFFISIILVIERIMRK